MSMRCPACQSDHARNLIQTNAQMHPSNAIFQFQQCEQCDLVFLNPRVPLEQLKDYYTDFYLPYRGASAWGKYKKQVESSQQKLDQKRAKWVGQYHKVNADTLILDIGCGQPSFLQACAQKYQCKTIGLDFTDEGWKAKPNAYQNIELLVGEVKDLPQDLKPDVITMWHYLEHDYDPVQTLKHLKSLSHEQTTLIIEVPNYDSESRKKYGEHWAGFHTPRHTFLFSPDNINLLLQQAGWATTKVNTFGTLDPYVLYWMSEMEQKKISWNKNMETEFFNYVKGMIGFSFRQFWKKNQSLGIMSVFGKISP